MPKMTVKPPFDLAAHLAKPATPREIEEARRRRQWLERFRKPNLVRASPIEG